MPKGYWVTCYRSISDPQKVAAYAKLAPLATQPFGCKYIARGTATEAFEVGQKERIVISEFPSVEKAIAAYKSPRLSGCAQGARQRCGTRHPHRRRHRLTSARPA